MGVQSVGTPKLIAQKAIANTAGCEMAENFLGAEYNLQLEQFIRAVLNRAHLAPLIAEAPPHFRDSCIQILRLFFRTWKHHRFVQYEQLRDISLGNFPCNISTLLMQVAMHEFHTNDWIRTPKVGVKPVEPLDFQCITGA
jgi:hypothetical protein